MKRLLASIFLSAALGTAHGAGPGAPPQAGSGAPAPVKLEGRSSSSYANSKENTFFSRDFPLDPSGTRPLTGDAQAFFTWPDGSEGLFLARLQYWNARGPGALTPSLFQFYKRVAGAWRPHAPSIEKRAENCLHPRKAIVADFNRDGRADFVIACHGYDARPYPGEHAIGIMSTPTGYVQDIVTDRVEFYHGGSAHDFNGDGYPDLVLTLLNGTRTFINDGTGKFAPSREYSFGQFRRAFHIELTDVDGDGKFDIVGGSHEWEDATRIVLNPGNNKFGRGAETIIIPPVPGGGTIVDFVYVKSNRALYVLRTGDGRYNGTTYYEGLWLQKFSLDKKTSTLLIADPHWTDPRYGPGMKWLRWIDEEGGYIVSNWGSAIKVRVD